MTTYRTSLGTSDRATIHLLGHDLAEELMGSVSFGDLAFWLVTLRRPTPGQSRLFNAVLVRWPTTVSPRPSWQPA